MTWWLYVNDMGHVTYILINDMAHVNNILININDKGDWVGSPVPAAAPLLLRPSPSIAPACRGRTPCRGSSRRGSTPGCLPYIMVKRWRRRWWR